ncbi:hypothetical protein A2625_01850 [candidate division WOR-1 bacterium RIFCSPHIGHO2_01_FULL_53_15]|uniref:Uncharacterized protein n=1 Tax=candidate division WOR-1 bacterium RIFCSPHIGHO2_01_FULL_53_15 TaxID=1802564 RepID=A0A1F4Q2A6_UNCSA|nr:MAG: hypothetical protein A2625_01850 [candidate division WOR-1 bacterium RIFCSPHIGHO2_01_FULL_53_15]
MAVFIAAFFLYYNFVRTTPLSELVANNYELTPSHDDLYGIDIDAVFILKSEKRISTRDVKKIIKFDPEVDYDVLAIDGREFILKPRAGLERNKVYKISMAIKNRNWAFQAREKFKVVGTLPRDEATDIPLNSGIELNFNFSEYKDYQDNFTIFPTTEGRFEKHKNTLVFIPKRLRAKTIYTVVVGKGLGLTTSKDTLGADYQFKFETGSKNRIEDHSRIDFRDSLYQFGVGEAPVMDIYSYGLEGKTLKVNVFEFKTIDEFRQAIIKKEGLLNWARYSQRNLDTDKYYKTLNFSANVLQANPWTTFIRFPGKLTDGYYLVEAEMKGKKAQAFLQISDVVAYAVNSRSGVLTWVNRIGSKTPAEGALVKVAGTGFVARTDKTGLAFSDLPEDVRQKGSYLDIALSGHKNLYLPLSLRNESASVWDKYWFYVYTDRKLYQPTDMVKIWGIVRKRAGNFDASKVSVELVKESWPSVHISKKEVRLSALGTFSDEFNFAALQPGHYRLEFKLGKEFLTNKYFQIQTYTKPAFKIEIDQDRKAIFNNDKAAFKVRSVFFEGTPFASQELSFSFSFDRYYYGRREGKAIFTDINGEKIVEYKGRDIPSDPSTAHLFVVPANAEEAEIVGEAQVQVFRSHVKLITEANVKNKVDGNLKVKAYAVDISRLNSGTENDQADYLGRPIAGQAVDLALTEIHYEKEDAGESYDFINKRVYKLYRYNRIEKELGSQKLTTGPSGECEYSFKVDPDKYYEVRLSAQDGLGHETSETAYLWGDMSYYYDNYSDQPALINKKKGGRQRIFDDYYGGYYDNWAPPAYSVGDKVEFEFVKGGRALPSGGNNRYLFYNAQQGILSYNVQNSPAYTFDFNAKHVPNLSVTGIYFDGRSYVSAGSEVRYNVENKKLLVKISTDKAQYKPKDLVDLKVNVTDAKGLPVKAEVNLNLVDEAFYMLSPEQVDPLNEIFAGLSSGIIDSYMSHQYPELESGAEKGGCFAAGTKILMGDGSYKNIEDVKAGDDILTRKSDIVPILVKDVVEKTFVHDVNGCLTINGRIKVTPGHRIFINKSWKTAGEAVLGDIFLDKNNNEVVVNSLEYNPGRLKVYNLKTNDRHTYFAEDVYVHNQKDESIRENFRDMAYFGSVITDPGGNAGVKFNLPDNLTSWRITAQAISPDMYAGHTVKNIPVSLPFFVETTYNKEFNSQDRPIIKIRSFGKALKEKQKVQYHVFAPTLGLESSPLLSAFAFKSAYFPLPALKEGEHRVGVSGAVADNKDSIVKPIMVVKSRFTKRKSDFYQVKAGLKIHGNNKGRTGLVFCDQSRGRFYYFLGTLAWTWGDRIEQKLSRLFGRQYLKKYFNDDVRTDEEIKVSGYQMPSGGIAILPYSGAEVPLSAKIAALDPELFSRTGLFSYLYSIVGNESAGLDEKCPAIFGLANLGKADLVQIKLILTNPNVSAMNRLYLGLAAHKIGDEDLAKEIYSQILRAYSKIKGRHAWLEVGQDMDDRLSVTSLAAIFAAKLGAPERDLLWNYVMDNSTTDILLNLEEIMYLNEVINKLPGNAVSFSVRTDKQKHERIELNKGDIFRMEVGPGELANIKYYDIKGEVGITAYYDQVISPAQLDRDPNIAIQRKYYVDDMEVNTLSEGDLVQVRLYARIGPNALGSAYQIMEILPSGLKYVNNPYARGGSLSWRRLSPYEINNQQLKFAVYKSDQQPEFYYYYAMVINKGEYVAEPAVIRSFINTEILNLSDSSKIEIK